jgi:hypothetical protein
MKVATLSLSRPDDPQIPRSGCMECHMIINEKDKGSTEVFGVAVQQHTRSAIINNLWRKVPSQTKDCSLQHSSATSSTRCEQQLADSCCGWAHGLADGRLFRDLSHKSTETNDAPPYLSPFVRFALTSHARSPTLTRDSFLPVMHFVMLGSIPLSFSCLFAKPQTLIHEQMPSAVILLALLGAVVAQCDLTGNWTSTLSPNPSSVVHIEIFQDAEGNIVVRATPWAGMHG